jgi:Spy/CpxP family protein refolding chaperone
MNELKKIFLGLTAVTVVLANFSITALPSRAQAEAVEGPPEEIVLVNEEAPPPGGEVDCCQPWAEKLGLSDEQMEKLVSLKSEYMVKTAPQKAELRSDMKQMMLLMTASRLDRQAITSLHDKMSDLHADLCKAHMNHMIDAMEVLTPKQREDMHHHMLVHMVDPHHMHGKHHMFHHEFGHHPGGE